MSTTGTRDRKNRREAPDLMQLAAFDGIYEAYFFLIQSVVVHVDPAQRQSAGSESSPLLARPCSWGQHDPFRAPGCSA